MTPVVTVLLLALLQPAPPAPRSGPVDAGIRRIHLRNGDYIEGRIHFESSTALEVRLAEGSLLLPKSEVARIEAVRLPTHVTRASLRRTSGRRPVVQPLLVVHSARDRVDGAMAAARRGALSADETVKRMVEAGPEGALYLASSLEHIEPELRGLAVQSLHILNHPGTLGTLVRLFDSEDSGVRMNAAFLTASLGDRDSAHRMRKLLKDPDPPVRAAAISALEKLDDPAALDWIGPLCADLDPGTRSAALQASILLARRHEMREGLLWILDRALRWPPKDGAPDILKAIGGCGDPEAWTLAADHLRSSLPQNRAAAAQALALLGAPESARAVAEQTRVETEPAVRIQLAGAAERLRILDAVPDLIEWLSESDESVRRAALRALRSLSGHGYDEDAGEWMNWWSNRKTR